LGERLTSWPRSFVRTKGHTPDLGAWSAIIGKSVNWGGYRGRAKQRV